MIENLINDIQQAMLATYVSGQLKRGTPRPYILYVVMPNHIHAIVIVGTRRAALNQQGTLPETDDERALPGYVNAARRVPTSI